MRQLAIVRPAGNVEIHVAGRIAVLVSHHVAVAVVDDLFDQINHVDHVPVARGSYVGGSTPNVL